MIWLNTAHVTKLFDLLILNLYKFVKRIRILVQKLDK